VVASASTSTQVKLKSLDVQDEGMLYQAYRTVCVCARAQAPCFCAEVACVRCVTTPVCVRACVRAS
jgi:hypothetical protein